MPSKRSFRERVHELMNEPSSSRAAALISYVVLISIFCSTLFFVMESMPEYARDPAMQEFFFQSEVVVVAIFTCEYMIRFIGHPGNRFSFMLEPLNAVDLLAILPFYLETFLTSFVSKGTLSVLRVVRVVRLARLLKLAKYSKDLQLFGLCLLHSWNSLVTLVVLLGLLCLIFSSLLWYAEKGVWSDEAQAYLRSDGEPSPFDSIPTTLWWGIVTMTTVGYGDMYPIEVMGKIMAAVTMISGVLVIALPVSVIGANFNDLHDKMVKLENKQHSVTIQELAKSIEEVSMFCCISVE